MSYSNAIFHIDLVNGSDTARTALTSCTASNPSGTITRINKSGHNLVTGAVVTLSAFSTWLNADWKISVVDANNFDLVGAVWQTTADASGTVTPFGGSSWTDAWKTITTGATAARIAPGDVIRLAKTPDPVSIGNATWTYGSAVVALAAAQTVTVELCDTVWTAATNVTTATSTSRKQGTNAAQISVAAGFTTGLVAYKALSATLNLSSYQKLSFWLSNSAAIASATVLRVCLCSDSAGTTIVDSFYVPAIPSTSRYVPITVAKSGGGNLGASINSVAIYADSDPGTIVLTIDDIIACTTSGLNLQSLISKNGNAQGGSEGYYAIQSIDGTTVYLDGQNIAYSGSMTAGYSGATETVTSYFREAFKTGIAASGTTNINTINDSGTIGNYIEFQGGYNTASGVQDGETFFDGLTCNGVGFNLSVKSYIKFNWISAFRYNIAFNFATCVEVNIINISNVVSNQSGLYYNACSRCKVTLVSNANNNGTALYYYSAAANITIDEIKSLSNNQYGVYFYLGSNNLIKKIANAHYNYASVLYFYLGSCKNRVKEITSANNNMIVSYFDGGSDNYFRVISSTGGTKYLQSSAGNNYCFDSSFSGTTEFTGVSNETDMYVFAINHNAIAGNNKVFGYHGVATWQTTTKHDTDPGSWKIELTGTSRIAEYPFKLKVADIAVDADLLTTVKVWVKKDHATNIGARIKLMDNNFLALAETTVNKADDTNWEQLILTFTPAENGVVEVYLEAYYVAGLSNVYLGSIEVAQA